MGHIFRLAQSPQHDLRQGHLPHLLWCGLDHLCLDQTRRDSVNVDVAGAQLAGTGLSESDHPCLGCRVIGLAELAAQAVDGGDVNDLTGPLLAEDGGDGPRIVEGALQVHPDDPVPLFLGHLPNHAVPVHSGVVDQDVQPTELVEHFLHHRLGVVEAGHIGLDGQGAAAHAANRLGKFHCQLGALVVVESDVGAVGGQVQHDGPPDPPRAACNNGDFAFQFHIPHPLRSTMVAHPWPTPTHMVTRP